MKQENTKEASNKYAASVIESFGHNGVPSGISDIRQMIADGFIAGVRWHKSNQWIKIKEGCNLPKDEMSILVRRHYKDKYGKLSTKITQEIYFEDYGFKAFCSKRCDERITHWMPIPNI